MLIKLKVKEFDDALKERKWSDAEVAARMGISTVQIWRVRLPDNDERHNDPGKDFIAGAMTALEKKFEDLFFLAIDLRCRNKEAADKVDAGKEHPATTENGPKPAA